MKSVKHELSPYLQKLSRTSESTAHNYQLAFTALCILTSESPSRIFSDLKYGKRDVYRLLDSYVGYLLDDLKVAPSTVHAYLSGVKRILRFEDIEVINERLKQKVVLPRMYPVTSDRIPTLEEFQKMMNVADLRGKTMMTMLASSGMRIGELLSLRVGDVVFGTPTRVNIRALDTKTKQSRLVFISEEATKLLKQFLGERMNCPESWVFIGSESPGKRASDPNRPMTYENALCIFHNILEKVGLTERSMGRHVIHSHCLRKFFFTHMLSGLGREYTEALMGHAGYLDESYMRRTAEDFNEIAAKYVEAMDAVTIVAPRAEVRRQDVESLASFKSLEMNLGDSEAILQRAQEAKGSELSIDEKVEVLQQERIRKVDEERTRFTRHEGLAVASHGWGHGLGSPCHRIHTLCLHIIHSHRPTMSRYLDGTLGEFRNQL